MVFCNLVFKGGGTLGLAHVGFVIGLECAGVRFVGLAGTSAGSILAMGIAAIRGDDLLRDLKTIYAYGETGDPVLEDHDREEHSLKERPGVALLQLTTMAMPVGLKFKLPQDLYYLSPEYEATSPARLVRTSMSIPAFFDPVAMQTNRATWSERVRDKLAIFSLEGTGDDVRGSGRSRLSGWRDDVQPTQ